ncbi:MAG: TraX family protein [Oscillospiraceae bacterium]
MEEKTFGLTANALKIYAVVAMIIDHFAWAFIPSSSPLGAIMHFIGRTCAPLICFFVAEGYLHTKSLKKYAFRLAIFAVVSQVPFSMFVNSGKISLLPTNMIFTLLCGLLALCAWNYIENRFLSCLCVLALVLITNYSDWKIFGVVFILIFAIFNDNRKMMLVAYASAALLKIGLDTFLGGFNLYTFISRLGIFVPIILITLYNGKRSTSLLPISKWFFYIAYPLQFILLIALRLCL